MHEGRWVGDVVWVADWPGFGKKGDKVKCYVEIKSSRMATHFSQVLRRNGSRLGSRSTMPPRKIVETSCQLWWNNLGTSVIYKDDGNWVGSRGQQPRWSKVKSKDFMTISDNGNKHSLSGSTTIGGKPADELQDVWVRVSDK